MCKIEKGEIQRRINEEIRRNFQNIKWVGIKIENVAKLNTTQAILSNDFQYKGEGNYPFEGTIKFQEIIFPEKDTLSRLYQFSLSNRVYLKEGKEDVEIKINEPIFITPKL